MGYYDEDPEEYVERKRLEKKRMKRKALGWLSMIPISIILAILISVIWSMGGAYTYYNEAGAHFENAQKMNVPEAIIEELELAKEGLRSLGLEDDMYSRWFHWEKTPHYQMSYQYERIDTIIERAWDVIEWRNLTYEDNTTTEILDDVYHEKVNHIREMINLEMHEVAYGTYMMNMHPVFYWSWILQVVLSFAIAPFSVIMVLIYVDKLLY